ncbi:TNT domain-containing protein [Haloechinothrix aidingensis]|uniref:TNT domain-containing protein n=1 Tax=Haloechinothrix aidingensis TaxID=2752311 RepID=UPI0031B5ECA8
MRRQVRATTHPDGAYASWNGRVLSARTSAPDGAVHLVAAEHDPVPEGFDTEVDGLPAKAVERDRLPCLFHLTTHCVLADEQFAVAEWPDDHRPDRLRLRWTGTDRATATRLGLDPLGESGSFGTEAGVEELTALWQVRRDLHRAGPPHGDATGTDGSATQRLLHRIGRELKRMRSADARGIAARFRQVGDYAELEVREAVGDVSYCLAAPPRLGNWFDRLRAAMYEPEKGTWFQATFSLTADDRFDLHYDSTSRPTWRCDPERACLPDATPFAAELERYPRDRDQVPPWLAALAGLPLGVEFRRARVIDAHTPGEPPVVNRTRIPRHEIQPVLGYLYRAPVVLVGEGPQPDLFSPHDPPDVPHAFHTDGTWIWPAAVPHYLRKHGVPPEHGLLDHIRTRHYRPPYVSQLLRRTARAELDGEPFPAQSAADLDERDPVTEVERDDSSGQALRASEVLTVLRRRLAEQGVSPEAYRIGETAPDAWCLLRAGARWEVVRFSAGEVGERETFDSATAAAAHLLGALTLFPTRTLAEHAAEEDPSDWPIAPLPGEPPLAMLRSRRMVVLPTGAILIRFGADTGNLVHAPSTRFPETSLLPEREHQRTEYRVLRPLRALAGVSLPWSGMPGGALSYLLPHTVGHHLATGALAVAG